MINLVYVHNMFKEWRENGIKYPYPVKGAKNEDRYLWLAKWFVNRYMFLQDDELQRFSSLVMQGGHWPKKEETEKLIELVMADNMQGLDYTAPFEPAETEDYDSYVQRIGHLLFPKKNEQWIYDNAQTIRIVYESYYCCAHCRKVKVDNRKCPYGNRMLGVISKQDGHLQAKRVAGQCDCLHGRTQAEAVPPPEVAAAESDADSEEERKGNDVLYEKAQYACDLTNYGAGDYPMESLQ